MNVRKEIEKFSSKADRPTLLWLFDRYHMDWQWRFVAKCAHQPYGTLSYETNRVWEPTLEGRVLYENMGHCVKSDPKRNKFLIFFTRTTGGFHVRVEIQREPMCSYPYSGLLRHGRVFTTPAGALRYAHAYAKQRGHAEPEYDIRIDVSGLEHNTTPITKENCIKNYIAINST